MRKRLGFIFALSILFLMIDPSSGHPLDLITLEEALRPEAPFLEGMECSRLEGDGPQVKINSPNLDRPLLTPLRVEIEFEASPDKMIDYESLRVKYLKFIPIDLTDRVKPFLSCNRLVLTDVKVPPGRHCLQLVIAYVSGEKTLMEMFLNVIK